jgi:hypothetical protein
MIGLIEKYIISSEINQWESRQKVLQYTQDNKVCMLKNNIFGNLDFFGYSNLGIKVFTYLHEDEHELRLGMLDISQTYL